MIAAFCGLIVLAPVFLVVSILVRRGSSGPVFYFQERVGRGGKRFKFIKFRTMRVGADGQGSITLAYDDRITAVGRRLRHYKLDELPQLWHVLKGDMSFVGPRPDVPGYADRLEGDERLILALRPGITGPATLAFRGEGELLAQQPDPRRFNDQVIYPAKTRLNLHYARNWCFWRDIGYILVTIFPRLDGWLHLTPERGLPEGGVAVRQ